jgi:hypothetical protein
VILPVFPSVSFAASCSVLFSFHPITVCSQLFSVSSGFSQELSFCCRFRSGAFRSFAVILLVLGDPLGSFTENIV